MNYQQSSFSSLGEKWAWCRTVSTALIKLTLLAEELVTHDMCPLIKYAFFLGEGEGKRRLNSGPIPQATPPPLFGEGFFTR
jgi:hypothetical protein